MEVTSEHGVNSKNCENYHLYMITLKPNFTSYVKKSIGNCKFMLEVFEIFMTHFCQIFKFVDSGIEYDSKNVCHIHVVLATNNDIFKFRNIDSFNISNMINFKKGIYVDVRAFPSSELDRVITYINKGQNEPRKVMDYYRSEYGFI